jgi:nitrite reductase/ring-hydroxylating ferredoxin subunit
MVYKDDAFKRGVSMTVQAVWRDAIGLENLKAAGRKVLKIDGKQIVLFLSGDRILACNNRCPHEGYPLAEGNLADGSCVLTCNWHNWKFDLDSGETLVGGDTLRRYPTRVVDGRVELDVADPPADEVIRSALANLEDCFDRHEYDRMAREIARLMKAGGDPLDALRRTIAVTADRFEYGASHALPASADWLDLRAETPDDPVRCLAMLTECVGHFAWDTRREPSFPYPTEVADWDEESFVAAVEAEDEATACAQVRGAIASGMDWADMERGFARAALAHYADFGHSTIYTYKMRALTARLGDRDSLLNLALLLTRSLVYATREDLIPEFRPYAPALASWDATGAAVPEETDLRKGSVRSILAALAAGGGDVAALYDAAMAAACWQMLHFDLSWQDRTDSTVSQNVNWLDFTHALTFGNAARKLCETHGDLWPNAILQLGCFLGRNSAYTDPDLDEAPWRSNDPVGDVDRAVAGVVDHGQFEYIVACHLLKLSVAVREEREDRPDAPWHPTAAAALTRFLNSPFKRKHTLRVAHQSLDFVRAEG